MMVTEMSVFELQWRRRHALQLMRRHKANDQASQQLRTIWRSLVRTIETELSKRGAKFADRKPTKRTADA